MSESKSIVNRIKLFFSFSSKNKQVGFSHTNSKGVKYHLNVKAVTLRGGKVQDIYYFSKDYREDTATDMPKNWGVRENPRNGFLTVDKPNSEKASSCEEN